MITIKAQKKLTPVKQNAMKISYKNTKQMELDIKIVINKPCLNIIKPSKTHYQFPWF